MAKIDFGVKRPDDFYPIPDSIVDETIIQRFEEMVEKHPERVAIESEGRSFSYRELNNAINDLAYQIVTELGADKSPVAFLFRDEVYSIVAFMASIKSGRAYTGLHPSNSIEQLKAYWEDSTARLLITGMDFRPVVENMLIGQGQTKALYFDRLKTESDHPNPQPAKLHPRDPFAIFYTSGSTGKPKGVASTQNYTTQMILYMTNEWFFSPSDRVTLFTSVCFLAGYPSVLGALLNGGTLCMFDLKTHSAQAALDWIRDPNLTVLRCTPSIFRTVFGLAPAGLVFEKLRFITLGGEPVTDNDVAVFKAHTADDCILINNLAATEVNLICHNPVSHRTPPFTGFLPAGYPAPGKEFMLVDEEGKEVEAGQEGEIVVRSPYLSLGYWRKPELTAQKFFSDPYDPKMWSCFTGDHGRLLENGMLEVLGRKDTQVKIRGYRVQLESIDLTLRAFPGVRDAATIIHRSAVGGGERLVAYVCLAGPEQLSVSQMRKYLSSQLPAYMIPSTFVQVDALPRTATGKLARLQLPEPSNARPDLEPPFVAPRNEAERKIAAIWEQVLEVKGIGVNDNFFELGGDSLMALQMTLDVENAISKTVPQSFFATPTIASLAQASGAENPAEEALDKFVLASYPKDEPVETGAMRRKPNSFRPEKLVTRDYSRRDLERMFDQLVARIIVGKPYLDAREWSVKWSRNALARNVFYWGRYALFSQFIASLKDCQVQPAEVFPMSVQTSLSLGLVRFLGNDWKNIRNDIEAIKRSRYPYWHSLAQLIDSSSAEQLEQNFPINGLEHLMEAYQAGKGVILLTFHGANIPAHFMVLGKRLGVDEIPTISHRIPARQSEFGDETDRLSYEVASTLNAEIALYAQRRLQEGKLVNIVGDTSDAHGRRYEMAVGGRLYQIKGGFAELALNTGAKIIQHYGRFLPDGRPQLNFMPPLDPGNGDRSSQVERLISEYVSFIQNVWITHPEAVWWSRIRRHFFQPVA
jgi:amino acid adenylation domain-containing protein